MLHQRSTVALRGPRSQPRSGLTLMEVIVALGIFLASMVAIGNLLYMGMQRALEAQQQAIGLVRCQSKMSEVIVGALAVTSSQNNVAFEDDNTWVWSMESTEEDIANLYRVKITVCRQHTDGPKVEVSLSQMILDPNYRGVNNGNNSVGGSSSAAASKAAPSSSSGGASGSSGATQSATSGGSTK